jgi:ubiquitin carboxyl-terminal hydrolase 7
MVKLVLLKLQPCYWNSGRYKFDDERVTKEELKRALDEQYGGEEELPQTNPGFNNTPFKFTKYSNAYMLVYIRDADKDKVVCNVDEKDIAEHLQIRLKKEHEEKVRKRKDKAEAHLYTIIKVAQDIDLSNQIGKDIHFDLVDHDKVHSFRIQKQTLFTQFKVCGLLWLFACSFNVSPLWQIV